jgi:hypothetical protein
LMTVGTRRPIAFLINFSVTAVIISMTRTLHL